MGRILIRELLERGDGFACPDCRKVLVVSEKREAEILECPDCSRNFEVFNQIPLLMPSEQKGVKGDIQKFWGELYRAAYAEKDKTLKTEKLDQQLEQLEALFKHREHLAVTEMPYLDLRGKKVLEIGPGAGAHSALFAKHGAHMYSMDITHDRVVATAAKLDMIRQNNETVALQADAEKLPFLDNYFDIVYSNGVLHHSPDTDKTIQEAFRVLKPGGKAVIMLYARDSFYYWFVIFFLKGVCTGQIFRHKNWLGRVTEWMSDKKQQVLNPETKVYSKRQIHKLFRPFKTVAIRKNSFNFEQIPVLGKILARLLKKKTGINKAGELIYGHGWRNETSFELFVGKFAGFALNIKARK